MAKPGFPIALVAGVAIGLGASGCSEPAAPPDLSNVRLTRLQAYYCAIPNQSTCDSRGAPIPAGTKPPVNEAFQVWAFYQGFLSTYWRLNSRSDSVIAAKTGTDSANVWIDLVGAAAGPVFTLHVFIQGAGASLLTHDSLRWDYSP